MSELHADFETRSTVDLKTSGADVYARHPSTDINCFGFAFDEEPPIIIKRGEPLPKRVEEQIRSGGTLIAHNAAFELVIWNNVCVPKYGWPKLNANQCECTMAMSYAMAIPASLEKAAAAMGINQQKDMTGQRVMLQLARPRDTAPDGSPIWWEEKDAPEKFEKLYAYCKQDIEVERELKKRLMQLSPKEKTVWLLDQKINQTGVRVDIKAVRAAIGIIELEKKRLDLAIRDVTNNAVATCTAVAQLTDWIKFQGIDLDGVAKADILYLLSKDHLPEPVRQALLLRQEAAKSSTAKLNSMLNRVCPDGRIRGIFQYHGAATGRWAGRGIQPQNFPRNSISQDDIEGVFKILGDVL
jgi:DNA polymerase